MTLRNDLINKWKHKLWVKMTKCPLLYYLYLHFTIY